MYCLRDEHIEFIHNDIMRRGIKLESLQQELLDHICTIIEQNLEADDDFISFYSKTITSFYKEELKEIEEQTLFLLSCKGPHVLLSRNAFFLLLFSVIIGPYIVTDLICFISQNNWFNIEILSGTFVYALFPLLVLFVLYTTPDRLDPVIPKHAKILIGIRPFMKLIRPGKSIAISH